MLRVASLAFILAAAGPTLGAPLKTVINKTIQVDGLQRHYLAFAPDHVKEPLPVVIVLHGGGGNASQIQRVTGFNDLAAKHGFVVVYPDSAGGYWNDGRGVEFMRAQRENINDVKFIRSILDDLAKDHKIDRSRVFSTGLSNGGLMSHRLAAEASDAIAGIAPVCGGMAPVIAATFKPQFPVSILIIQGAADPVVPIDGGDIVGRDSTRGKVIPTKDTLAKYLERNGNANNPMKTKLDPKDENIVEVSKYPDGPGGAKTWFYLVKNGGHRWPARSRNSRPKGTSPPGFSATERIWDFFSGCPPRSR